MRISILALTQTAAAIFCLFHPTAEAAQTEYELIDVTAACEAAYEGAAEIGFWEATALNDLGDVVGIARPADSYYDSSVFLWSAEAGLTFTPQERLRAQASSVNNLGQVAGYCPAPSTPPEEGALSAFSWTPNGEFEYLEGCIAVSHDLQWRTGDINDAGHILVVKYMEESHETYRWEDGTLTPVLVPGDDHVVAVAMNASGQIVGLALGGENQSFFWDETTGPTTEGFPEYGLVQDLNDLGQAVGYISRGTTNPGPVFGFLWEDGEYTEIPYDGGYFSAGWINNDGLIAGSLWEETSDGYTDGSDVLWDEENGFRLLSDLLPSGSGIERVSGIIDINNEGYILFLGTTTAGEYREYILRPIPEPSSVLLAGLLIGWVLVGRRAVRMFGRRE